MDGRVRVVISNVQPTVDAGTYPAKRVVGEPVVVEADLVADGHDLLRGAVRHRPGGGRWTEVEMALAYEGLDRWSACFVPRQEGRHEFVVRGWIDHAGTWLHGTRRKLQAGQDVTVELLQGAEHVEAARDATKAAAAADLDALAAALRKGDTAPLTDPTNRLGRLLRKHGVRSWVAESRAYEIVVDRERAAFSTWYELFPRSVGSDGERHGTLGDVAKELPRVASMGFDVLYLPPIHPIGRAARKGPNNSLTAGPDDVGSPWAIGSEEGGHTAVHPQLGPPSAVRDLVTEAKAHGMEVALDLAFQCSPDHPWITQHPSWFKHRPDGSIQYAENPPKRYEDIVPIDFETEDWLGLWAALRTVVGHWVDQGVRIFRVDNPHTKALPFWAWLIPEVKASDPDVLFLAEAFTRPRIMEHLAKIGFSQSYTYFTWRRDAAELREYFEELTQTERVDYMRPNVWPNTPDILSDQLQTGARGMFATRALLAATLCSSYGIYGPAFELLEHEPREPGSEEYRDSEKYQLRSWDHDDPRSLAPLLTRLNHLRHEHPALQTNRTLHFHDVDGDDLLCFSKRSFDGEDVVLVVVNAHGLDRRAGMVHLDLEALGLEEGRPFQVHDRLGDGRWTWSGPDNYVELDPEVLPGHVFTVGPVPA
ncbi:MAG TPA: alpha-1,4-glucan--maltose-1-phosphate maltosyltransferase [Acidimicrobiales bacterium]|nr:alpha-1,4-glucan--maltose-1-phosphate maltosyltransferase [Acidimicrobiales bacterium]